MKRILIITILVLSLLAIPVHAQGVTLNPYDSTVTPSIGVYTVAPLYGNYLALYAPPYNAHGRSPLYYYPATWFLQSLNLVSGTTDLDCINLNGAWLTMMSKLNGPAWNYLHNSSDGYFFNSTKLCAVTSPGNTLNILQWKYRDGQWWGRVQHIPYTITPPAINPSITPAYLLGQQTDENSVGNVSTSMDQIGLDVYVPVIADKDIWIPLAQLMYNSQTIIANYMVNTTALNLRTGPSVAYSIIYAMPQGTMVGEITTQGGWMEVQVGNQTGWCNMIYLEAA